MVWYVTLAALVVRFREDLWGADGVGFLSGISLRSIWVLMDRMSMLCLIVWSECVLVRSSMSAMVL